MRSISKRREGENAFVCGIITWAEEAAGNAVQQCTGHGCISRADMISKPVVPKGEEKHLGKLVSSRQILPLSGT